MRYTTLGGTGLKVSRLCLGTMTFGKQTDEPETRRILDKAAAEVFRGDMNGTRSSARGDRTMAQTCEHLDEIRDVTPRTPQGCEECLKSGDAWVHLRLCQSCGHVGCCDSSPNRHATKHFHSSGHPVIKSFEPGEQWGWCYADELFFESL